MTINQGSENQGAGQEGSAEAAGAARQKLFELWCEPRGDFFARIDACGGWPVAATQVVMRHTVERERPCYFSAAAHHIGDEWNTTVAWADDYHLWKLSAKAKAAFIDKAKRQLADKLAALPLTAEELTAAPAAPEPASGEGLHRLFTLASSIADELGNVEWGSHEDGAVMFREFIDTYYPRLRAALKAARAERSA